MPKDLRFNQNPDEDHKDKKPEPVRRKPGLSNSDSNRGNGTHRYSSRTNR